MQEHRQVSLAPNEVGDNQLSSCFPPAKACSLCEALLALAPGHTGASPAIRKDDRVLPLLRVLALWSRYFGQLYSEAAVEQGAEKLFSAAQSEFSLNQSGRHNIKSVSRSWPPAPLKCGEHGDSKEKFSWQG